MKLKGLYFIKKSKKLYLDNFEFISSEYKQPFQKFFYAIDEKHLAEKILEYFIDYYGEGNTSEIYDNVYFYHYGEIAVRKRGWIEIKSFKQLLNCYL